MASGTPYVVGGDSPAGTDCSGLVSWVTNAATERPVFGGRFNTGNEEAALLQRGFRYGTRPMPWWSGGMATTRRRPCRTERRCPAVKVAAYTSVAGAPTSHNSPTTCSCRCRTTARVFHPLFFPARRSAAAPAGGSSRRAGPASGPAAAPCAAARRNPRYSRTHNKSTLAVHTFLPTHRPLNRVVWLVSRCMTQAISPADLWFMSLRGGHYFSSR